jgi:hypothetical protein
MKRFFLFLFVAMSALACKKDDPDTQLSKIAGKWEMVAREELVEGKYVWKDVQSASPTILVFRPDGLVTDTNGLPQCCGPNSLSIDGNLVKIVPKGNVPYNEMCERVNCAACETLGIETKGNEIVISSCGRIRARYVRAD